MVYNPQLIISFMQLIFWSKSFSGASCADGDDACIGAGQRCNEDTSECECSTLNYVQAGDVCVIVNTTVVGKLSFAMDGTNLGIKKKKVCQTKR